MQNNPHFLENRPELRARIRNLLGEAKKLLHDYIGGVEAHDFTCKAIEAFDREFPQIPKSPEFPKTIHINGIAYKLERL